ncbi:hypothetical protein [Pectinatus frisingensis]|uniref:hypothetical protein n=1 Tax=Pectinatus frisingensis TaxID=865 RepID=UPI003D807821
MRIIKRIVVGIRVLLVSGVLFCLHFIRSLLYGPDGMPSLLAVITCGMFGLFVFVTLYLVLNHMEWSSYTTFAATTTTLSAGGKAADKFMNNRFHTGGDA